MAAKGQKHIFLSPDTTIITPAARDQAMELGIEIVEEPPLTPPPHTKEWKKIREAIIQCLKEDFGDQQFDEETIGTIVRMVLGRLG